jgi:uncharacterized protein YigA (DUF484 family)
LPDYDIKLDHLRSHTGELPHQRYLSNNQPVCTTLRPDELDLLFPAQQHESEGSAVLVPLLLSNDSGCLAIGSRNPSYFSSDMDTLFVTYIVEVLTRVVQRLTS